MKIISVILIIMLTIFQDSKPLLYDVSSLANIPDRVGFAGSIGGTSNGVLIMAGGSNFPEGTKPWSGGIKKWYNDIYVLKTPESKWEKVGNLPVNLGYAVSVHYKEALICVGGSNELGHSAKVFALRWQLNSIKIDYLPDLPFTLANACGAVVGDKLFVAGGIKSPDSREASNAFLVLDLSHKDNKWQVLSSWPGASRMLSVAAATDTRFLLFSGTDLEVDSETGNVKRRYLRDAYAYEVSTAKWQTLTALPVSTVAASGPAIVEKSRVLILGGDNGDLAEVGGKLQDKHPGFGNAVMEYDLKGNSWSKGQDFPVRFNHNVESLPNESEFLPVTAPLVKWKDGYVLIGGEVRPGTRTPRVYFIKVK